MSSLVASQAMWETSGNADDADDGSWRRRRRRRREISYFIHKAIVSGQRRGALVVVAREARPPGRQR